MNPTSPLSPSQLRYLNTGENECNLARDSHGIKGASDNVTGGLNKSLKWSSPPLSFRAVLTGRSATCPAVIRRLLLEGTRCCRPPPAKDAPDMQ